MAGGEERGGEEGGGESEEGVEGGRVRRGEIGMMLRCSVVKGRGEGKHGGVKA